jgi:ribosomal-protein-alanine N-acetyltransferase
MLETERLLIRKFTVEDLPQLVALRSDPEVNQYLGGGRLQNAEAVERRLQIYIESYSKYGFGVCAMIWKETGEMCGWSGLMPLENTGKTEVGYGMAKKFWRRGIGSEAARAWLEFGFTKTDLEKIYAIAMPENTASWRIMEKLGMSFERIEKHYDLDCKVYSITKNEFLNLLQSDL